MLVFIRNIRWEERLAPQSYTLPMDTKIDSSSRLSLDYHIDIAIFFERFVTNFKHGDILTIVMGRLVDMKIPIGMGMADPIYIPYKEKEKNIKQFFRNGSIRFHYIYPRKDGINTLKELLPFTFNLNNATSTLKKVCKS